MRGRRFLLLLAALYLVRLATLGLLPLFDSTEGRYAEIGREMAASGNWVTPTLHGGEPFWAKPPLHFWLTALSIRAFGANEWAARLPSLVVAALTLALVAHAGRAIAGADAARLAVLLLGTSGLFFLLSGTVILDGTFTLCTTGALAAFLLHARDPERRGSSYLFFCFLGLGLLAKGPTAAILVLGPPAVWSAVIRRARALRSLPWGAGAVLASAIAAPWYVLAERATPGFWKYYFVHEHFLRYLRKEYGDLYGHGHVSPYGLVWVLGFLAFLPWTPALIGAAARAWRERRERAGARDARGFAEAAGARGAERFFLWIAAFFPLVFFTFSRSLSLPYVLPSLPFFALLLATEREGVERFPRSAPLLSSVLLAGGTVYALLTFPAAGGERATLLLIAGVLTIVSAAALRSGGPQRVLAAQAALLPVFVLAASVALPASVRETKSTRHLARAAGSVPDTGGAVLFSGSVPPSAEFYFRGRTAAVEETPEAVAKAAAGGERLIVFRKGREREAGSRVELVPIGGGGDYRYRMFLMRPAAEGAPAEEGGGI